MSDEHDAPELTPAQDAEVRRLLGALPPAGPMPDDVAARLDARLDALVAERALASDRPTGTDELAARRRRRRRLRTGLVAAASVAVLGVGIGIVADDLGGVTGGAASDSAVTAESQDARQGEPGAPVESDAGGGADAGARLLATTRQDLTRQTLGLDVARIADQAPRSGGRVQSDEAQPNRDTDGPTTFSAGGAAANALAPCAVPALEPAAQVAPVRLDGERATLVLHPARDGAREAEVYACDDGGLVLARVSVPAP